MYVPYTRNRVCALLEPIKWSGRVELCYVVLTPNNTTFGDDEGIQRSRDVSYEKYNDHRPLTWNLIWKPTVSCRKKEKKTVLCRKQQKLTAVFDIRTWLLYWADWRACRLSNSTQLTFRAWQRNGWVGKLRLKSLSLHQVLLTTRRSVRCYCTWVADNYKKLFHTLPDTGDETNYAQCVQALNKYFEIRKNVPKERHNFLSVSPEGGGGTINNFIIRLKKRVEHCEYGVEEEKQIRDRVLYFIRDKVLKRKLFREEHLSLTKLQEIANIFDEPEALLLSPAGTRENANTVYAKRTSGLRATARTFKGKCWKCDNLGHFAKYCRKSKNHTCEKCGKTGHFAVCCHTGQSRGGATGGRSYRKPTYESRGRGRGRGKQNVRNIDKQDTELGEEDTFYVFSVNTSACTMAINIDDTPVNMIIDSGSSCNIIPEATFRKMPGLTLKCNNRVYA